MSPDKRTAANETLNQAKKRVLASNLSNVKDDEIFEMGVDWVVEKNLDWESKFDEKFKYQNIPNEHVKEFIKDLLTIKEDEDNDLALSITEKFEYFKTTYAITFNNIHLPAIFHKELINYYKRIGLCDLDVEKLNVLMIEDNALNVFVEPAQGMGIFFTTNPIKNVAKIGYWNGIVHEVSER
jgi:hypothetical protein